MSAARDWTIDQEIKLFSLVCDYKPAGQKKDENMAQIVVHINEGVEDSGKFTADQIWSKLSQHYNLAKVDEIEEESESEEGSATPSTEERPTRRKTNRSSVEPNNGAEKIQHSKEKEGAMNKITGESKEEVEKEKHNARDEKPSKKEEKPPKEEKHEKPEKSGLDEKSREKSRERPKEEKSAKDDISDTLEPGDYSSELSDVEGDDAELAKLEGDELLSTKKEKGASRGKAKALKKQNDSDTALRKRTRSIAKLDAPETLPQKKRHLRANTPPATSKRRTRSEVQEEEPSAAKEEPKARRSTRQAVRRSGRKK